MTVDRIHTTQFGDPFYGGTMSVYTSQASEVHAQISLASDSSNYEQTSRAYIQSFTTATGAVVELQGTDVCTLEWFGVAGITFALTGGGIAAILVAETS